MTFEEFFQTATGYAPYPFQRRWALRQPNVVEIATGLGKTEAAVLAWYYHWWESPDSTPRRLIYCLPMRSLVDQTRKRIEQMRDRLEKSGLSVPAMPVPEIVMGGEIGERWFERPEDPAIVIGTQDMLLSRALNRGYGMSRYLWPMTFGATNNDVLWVIDEVQLQGVGARTAAQLQGLRLALGALGKPQTIFMSATLDRRLITTPDYAGNRAPSLTLNAEDLANERVSKRINATKALHSSPAYEPDDVVQLITKSHRAGTLTLVVVNTVKRAQEIYRGLQRSNVGTDALLMHSRFRPVDREKLAARLTHESPNLIAISTQVVEAGLDINAATLITDLAPWSSLVQRFGRCNRNGEVENATIFWLDPGSEIDKKRSLPYEVSALKQSRMELIGCEGKSVGPAALPSVEEEASAPTAVLRRVDLLDLFDTTTDMLGHDVDVSQFIRDGDDFSAFVFWRDEAPSSTDPPRREELCSASVSDIRKLVDSVRKSDRRDRARVTDRFAKKENREWVNASSSDVQIGSIVWLHCSVGGYDSALGFTGIESKSAVEEILSREAVVVPVECGEIGSEPWSESHLPVTISQHGIETEVEARDLTDSLSVLVDGAAREILTAALWHDVGKAHDVFQNTMYNGNPNPDELLAKSNRHGARHSRPYFRHEVASALMYLAAHDEEPTSDIVAYLIAAHHGKARLHIQPVPGEFAESHGIRRVMGLQDGDAVPSVALRDDIVTPAIIVDLDAFDIATKNDRPVWIDRTSRLRDDPKLGPFVLAYYELLVRLADWRASALHNAPRSLGK